MSIELCLAKKCAMVLTVDEVASFDLETHGLAIYAQVQFSDLLSLKNMGKLTSNSVNQPIGQVVTGLCSSRKIVECLNPGVVRGRGRRVFRWALEAIGEELEDKADDL